jgi:hypothetical protein
VQLIEHISMLAQKSRRNFLRKMSSKEDGESKTQNEDDNKKEKLKRPALVEKLMTNLMQRDRSKKELLQAAEEILTSIEPLLKKDESLVPIAERMLEPERVIQFRIAWVDDAGKQHINRGWRVQYSSAIGPYKGGLRFHPTVTSSVRINKVYHLLN